MLRFFTAMILLSAALVDLASTAHAQEWPRFRGPNGTGESEIATIPPTWTDDDYNWTVDLPGIGHSCPILWGNRLFILSADQQTATRHALCYDADTGEKLWRHDFASLPHNLHKLSSYASSTPAADADHVYFAWADPANLNLLTFTHDGELVWKKELGPWFGQHGFGSSPMLIDDLVILSNSQEAKQGGKPVEILPESSMLAFDRLTGEERWRTPRQTDHVTYSVPAVFQPADGPPLLVNTSTGNGLYALDPKTGEEVWSAAVFNKRTVSSPLVKGNLIFGSNGSGGGGNFVTAVRSDGKAAELAYQVNDQAPYVPCVVARDNLLFLISDAGVAACLDLPTGKVHWRKRIGGNYQGSPVRAADKIICPNADGEVVILAASDKFAELGRVKLPEGTRSTPAVARGCLYLRTFSHLMSIGGDHAKTALKAP